MVRGSRSSRLSRFAHAVASLTVVAAGACDRGAPISTRSWCTADSGVAVAFTAADDPGSWAHDGRGSPHFVELWRVGGLKEGEELGFPLNPSVSAAGRLAVPDWMLGNLTVLDADGTWYGDWARRGPGPGELARPAAVRWSGDSDSLTVFDIDAGKVEFLDADGPIRPPIRVDPTYFTPVVMSGSVRWVGVTPDAAVLLAPVPVPEGSSGAEEYRTAESPILLRRAGTDTTDTLATIAVPTTPERPFYGALPAPGWPTTVAAVDERGGVYVGGMDARYRIVVSDDSAGVGRIVCRDAPGLPLGERELVPRSGEDAELADVLAEGVKPDAPAPFGRIFVSHEGNLWVQRERPSMMGTSEAYVGVPGALYDVFDSEGAYLGEVRAPENARFQAAFGDTVWAYEIGDLDETWVVAYQMRWD